MANKRTTKKKKKKKSKQPDNWDYAVPIGVGLAMVAGVALAFTLSQGPSDTDYGDAPDRGTTETATPSNPGDNAPPAAPAPEADGPATVAARHILLQYAGSARAGADITRSQEEARQEAEGIVTRARATGADFEALAREHSDGPSGPRGGDLGSFGRSRMHPAFEAAAFALSVDEVSGIVETPFGYHVIQRYQ